MRSEVTYYPQIRNSHAYAEGFNFHGIHLQKNANSSSWIGQLLGFRFEAKISSDASSEESAEALKRVYLSMSRVASGDYSTITPKMAFKIEAVDDVDATADETCIVIYLVPRAMLEQDEGFANDSFNTPKSYKTTDVELDGDENLEFFNLEKAEEFRRECFNSLRKYINIVEEYRVTNFDRLTSTVLTPSNFFE